MYIPFKNWIKLASKQKNNYKMSLPVSTIDETVFLIPATETTDFSEFYITVANKLNKDVTVKIERVLSTETLRYYGSRTVTTLTNALLTPDDLKGLYLTGNKAIRVIIQAVELPTAGTVDVYCHMLP